MEYEQKLFECMIGFIFEHDFIAPPDNLDAFTFSADTRFRIPVSRKFIDMAGIDFDWDNGPAEGISEENVTYTLKLGCEFWNSRYIGR